MPTKKAQNVESEGERERRLREVIGELCAAQERGEIPDRQEVLDRHPDLADVLREFFAEQDRLHDATRPIGDQADPRWSLPHSDTALLWPVDAPAADDSPSSRAAALPVGSTTSPPAGTKVRSFGDYELVAELGRGGMGIVLQARQRSLNRPVALKMIRAGRRASSDDLLRLRNEAEAVANLDHPNIIPIYEVGEHRGYSYFAMKLVEGGTLAQRLGEYAAKPRGAARAMATVARAVHHAHQRGVLHCDLKPSNILIDAGGQPHVSDFGLAMRIKGDQRMTVPGVTLGSPPYMAAEQLPGHKGAVTTATDVYGLGAILYALLTKRPPFQAESVDEIVEQVKDWTPEPPGAINRLVDRDLEAICLKCLNKDPPRRYASALELAEDLERWLAGEPIVARPVGSAERAWRWCRRNPAVAGAVGTAAAALVAVAVISVLYASRQRQFAVEQQNATREITLLASGLEQSLTESNRLLAIRNFERAQAAFEKEQIGPGLLWMIESWRSAVAAGDLAWQQAARANVAAWQPYHARIKAVLSHPAPVDVAAFSPDGKTIVTGSDDRTARLWHAATGQPIGSPLAHGGEVIAVAFSPDGKTVLTACLDKSVRLWDAATGQPIAPPIHHGCGGAVAFGPDGKTFLAGCSDGKAQLWDTTTGLPVGTPISGTGNFHSVAFSPDGKTIVTGSWDGTARLWDATTGRHIGGLLKHQSPVLSVALGPDGKTLLTASKDGTGRLWDATTREPLSPPVKAHHNRIRAVAFSPDGKALITGSTDKTARLWDTATYQPIGTPMQHQGPVVAVAFSPDGKSLITASSDGTARLWDAAVYQPVRSILEHAHPVRAVAFSPDGKIVITGSSHGEASLRNPADGSLLCPPLRHRARVNAVAFSRDGKSVLTGSLDGTARSWNTATGQPAGPTLPHQGSVSAVAISPDGKTFLTGSQDHTLRLWDAASGALVGKPIEQPGDVDSAAFSPDGKTFVTGYDIGSAQLWDAATQTPIGAPLSHSGAVSAAAFSPDGSTLVTGCEDGMVRLWDPRTRTLRVPPLRHQAWVFSVAFSPDGKTVLTGCEDASARLWDAGTGMQLGPPLGHPGPVVSVTFSPDGKSFLSGSEDTRARIFWNAWDLPDQLDRVAAWVEILTGLSLDKERGSIQVLDNTAWRASRDRLKQLGGPPETTETHRGPPAVNRAARQSLN
jgi:WD40 repeat protein